MVVVRNVPTKEEKKLLMKKMIDTSKEHFDLKQTINQRRFKLRFKRESS